MSLSENVKALQTQANLTTAEFAEKAKLPADTINKIRSGATQNPNMDTLKRMAAALECTLDTLTGDPVPEEDVRSLLPDQLPTDPEAMVALFCQTLKRQTISHEKTLAEIRHDRDLWRRVALLALGAGVIIAGITLAVVCLTYWDLAHPLDGRILLGMINPAG